MPSSVGHALAGVAAAWSVDLIPGDRGWRTAPPPASWFRRAGGGLTAACAFLAAAPDLDLLFGSHRTVSHSIGAVIIVTIVAAVVTSQVTARPVIRVAAMCGLAYATHVLLDWLGVDRLPPLGIQALWPFSHGWYTSGWEWFPPTERRGFWTAAVLIANAMTVLQECVRLVPVLVVLWLVRVKALAGLPAEVAGRHHAAK
ncbi:MAG: metal-dependent hydrolase [Betaproteobacteria bacterium]